MTVVVRDMGELGYAEFRVPEDEFAEFVIRNLQYIYAKAVKATTGLRIPSHPISIIVGPNIITVRLEQPLTDELTLFGNTIVSTPTIICHLSASQATASDLLKRPV
ncbi:hypothetical protein GMRT_jh039 [Giardia muris]|uniref:Uncharacterized protein n=1 Tax=Giardia muris TaxID=5742 RepID=A0A4Z1T4V9_GIAMU|nr:hypothetical protein GMRT_jh039 [Giardia muris]|eukprot:TNJ28117.1 hypothetical protein GMRT_jh039 [Giardia muris]